MERLSNDVKAAGLRYKKACRRGAVTQTVRNVRQGTATKGANEIFIYTTKNLLILFLNKKIKPAPCGGKISKGCKSNWFKI